MKISIVIATYNAENHLEHCLKSILFAINGYQSEVEVIIVDGNSTDNTYSIVSKYKNIISYFHSEKDEGIYDAWNKGIKKSNGEWIMFLGADDTLTQHSIKDYLSAIALSESEVENTCQYISSKVQLVNSNGEKVQVIGEKYDWNKFKSFMNVAHVASLHRKTLFQDVGFYDTSFKISGDYELLLRKRNKLKAYFIDSITANMTIGGISFLSQNCLIETKRAKIKNKSNNYLTIELQYIWASIKLVIKKLIKYKY